jgi:signal transduction histidine kinase
MPAPALLRNKQNFTRVRPVSDREFFIAQQNGDAGTFVSAPYRPRAGVSTWSFGISRRRTTPDGRFDGTVHVTLDTGHFSDFWKTVSLDSQHVISLVRHDGEVLARYPAQIGERLKLGPDAPFGQALARSPNGLYTATSEVDGIERINGYRTLDRYPLTINYSVETRAILAPWWRNLVLYAGLAALGWAALIGVTRQALRRAHREAVAFEELQTETQRRRETEARLQQAQKMEAVGQLTGGIAHDFNNLLTVILGNAEQLAEELTDPQLHDLAEMILDAAERGADLTKHLLVFGRRQTLKPERLNLDEVLRSMEPLLRRTISENIEIVTQCRSKTFSAVTDRALLESALLNLVVNARDAMSQGGTLTIRTGERFATLKDGNLPAGQSIVFISVEDTGTGMPPEVLKRVFEPFYTTKEVGKGSGLGLSMVYGFADQAGGHVTIESTVGKGTCVTILLPAIDTPPEETAEDPGEASQGVAGGQKVLVVEDEDRVRHFVCAQLVALGYRVSSVSNGRDALVVLQEDGSFDLLLTDVVLPKGLTGVELAKQASIISPGIKVLLTSGYSEETFLRHGRPDLDVPILQKPYKKKQMAEALRKALEPPASQRPEAVPAGRTTMVRAAS